MDQERASLDEILTSCLEAVQSGQETVEQVVSRYPEQAGELRHLLQTAVWFSGHKTVVSPRPGFVSASRHRLVEQIKASQPQVFSPAGKPQPVPQAGWLERIFGAGRVSRRMALQLVLAVVMLACLVLTGTGIAYASQNTLPGDRLYPVKIGLERVELLVTLDEAQEIRLHTQFSQRRLVEIEELIQEGRFNRIQEAVTNFQDHLNQASNLLDRLATHNPQAARELAAELQQTFARQTVLLNSLASAVPANYRPDLLRALLLSETEQSSISSLLVTLFGTPTPSPTPGINQAVPPSQAFTATPSGLVILDTPTPTAGFVITATATSNTTIILSTSATPTLTLEWTPSATPRTPTATLRPPTFTPTRTQPPPEEPTPTFTPRPSDTPVPPHDTPVPPQETPKPPKPSKTPRPTREPPNPTSLPLNKTAKP